MINKKESIMNRTMMMALVLGLAVIGHACAAEIEVKNKFCPVSKEEVGSGGMVPHKVVYNGKTYNLCCAMCQSEFDKDPTSYAKAAEAQEMDEHKGM